MLQELQSVFECDSLKVSAISQQAHALYDLVEYFDAPQPTTCCYQYVPTKVGDSAHVQVHCYFPMPTLGVAHRVFDHWMNIFWEEWYYMEHRYQYFMSLLSRMKKYSSVNIQH